MSKDCAACIFDTPNGHAPDCNRDLRSRLEAALANNAVLFSAGRAILDAITMGWSAESRRKLVDDLGRAVTIDHPGAALLRRLKALQRVRDQLRDDVSAGCIRLVDECRALHDACAEADKEGA